MAFTKEVLDEILKSYSGGPEEFAALVGWWNSEQKP